jgi:hypothetical protein
MINVSIHLKDQSQPIIYENVINTYEKGSFFCVYCEGEKVYKYPICEIWRIKEDYGYHGKDK